MCLAQIKVALPGQTEPSREMSRENCVSGDSEGRIEQYGMVCIVLRKGSFVKCEIVKGGISPHRRVEFRNPICFDSRIERVSDGCLQDRARKLPWLIVQVDIFETIRGNGKDAIIGQVEVIIVCP
jgi:hypothetical protein